jgi:hypothetical protein
LSDAKRPGGSRDISDLKQRLGLKKAGAPAAAGRGNGGGGVVPPPGLNLPPPPGMATPQPAIPNAADDPFGAMNAMAAVGTVQRAPEIVIHHDGTKVENVGSSSMGAKVAKIGIPALATLVLGIALGKVSASANHHNDGVAGAKVLLGDDKAPGSMKYLKRQLADLDKKLENLRDKNGLRPDLETEKELQKFVAALEVPPQKLAAARNVTNIEDVATRIINWYAGAAEVKLMLENHLKSGKADAQQLAAAKKAGELAKMSSEQNKYLAGQTKYAVVMSAKATCDDNLSPADRAKKGCDAKFGAMFVELGPPFCNNVLATSGQCPEGAAVDAVSFRTMSNYDKGWQKGTVVSETADAVPSKGLVPLIDTEILDTFLKTNTAGASELVYSRRLKAIMDRTQALIKDANKLEADVVKHAKGERFTFFM